MDNELMTESILDPSGRIIASKRFDDDNDPNTPNEWADQYCFYHYDIRGSVTAIIEPDGSLITGYTYDEFGNLTQTEETTFDNEVTYTSSIRDTSTGLQYMNARYYNSTTGRFLSQDTYTGNAYEPWTQHLYSYCGNNPVNMIDPTGHIADECQGTAGNGRVNYDEKKVNLLVMKRRAAHAKRAEIEAQNYRALAGNGSGGGGATGGWSDNTSSPAFTDTMTYSGSETRVDTKTDMYFIAYEETTTKTLYHNQGQAGSYGTFDQNHDYDTVDGYSTTSAADIGAYHKAITIGGGAITAEDGINVGDKTYFASLTFDLDHPTLNYGYTLNGDTAMVTKTYSLEADSVRILAFYWLILTGNTSSAPQQAPQPAPQPAPGYAYGF